MSIAMQLSESEVEDFSTATTAEMLGLGSAAIKTRLHRARLFLRRELSSYIRSASKRSAGHPLHPGELNPIHKEDRCLFHSWEIPRKSTGPDWPTAVFIYFVASLLLRFKTGRPFLLSDTS